MLSNFRLLFPYLNVCPDQVKRPLRPSNNEAHPKHVQHYTNSTLLPQSVALYGCIFVSVSFSILELASGHSHLALLLQKGT
jgi:hypothetical protein